MATAKDCHTLTSYYIGLYNDKYNVRPVVNRHKARWGFDSVLYDLSLGDARELLDFYLETNSTHGHSLDWFFNNYDKLIVSKESARQDEEERRKLRAESKKRLEEWEEKNGNR